MEKVMLEEILRTNREDLASRYRSAASIMEECGDSEIASVMKTLSAQMDFDDSEDSVARDVINRTKDKLDMMIAERKKRNSEQYIQFVRDEEILASSGGEVTEGAYSDIHSMYTKDGLFDPDIFGGSGKMQSISSDETIDPKNFGKGIGHIVLPCRVILKKSYNVVASLLGMTVSDVESVVKYSKRVVINSNVKEIKKGQVLTEKEYNEKMTIAKEGDFQTGLGADALYEMLVNLHYADHPERLAFKVIPVIAPVFRPMAYLNDEHKFFLDCISRAYSTIIFSAKRCSKIMELGAPDIIMWNEKRKLTDKVESFEDIIHKHYKSAISNSLNNQVNVSYLSHLSLAERKRRIGFVFMRDEKASDIESLGVYPEKIQKITADGICEPITFQEVIESCHDSIFDYEHSNIIILEGDEPNEEEQAKADEVQEHMDMMNSVLDAIWNGAEEKREKFAVTFNDKLNMYEPIDMVC